MRLKYDEHLTGNKAGSKFKRSRSSFNFASAFSLARSSRQLLRRDLPRMNFISVSSRPARGNTKTRGCEHSGGITRHRESIVRRNRRGILLRNAAKALSHLSAARPKEETCFGAFSKAFPTSGACQNVTKERKLPEKLLFGSRRSERRP